MSIRHILLACILVVISQLHLKGLAYDSTFYLSAIVCDHSFHPVTASHVININTHQGDVTDSLGIFQLLVKLADTLMVRNIAYLDTLVPVSRILILKHIMLTNRRYQLQEAKIFEWGSTYSDFKEAVIEMPVEQTLGESLGLPTQDPDYVPFDMNEELIKSPGFLLTSPISYFYQNFNKQAKSARRVYWLEKNRSKQEHFDELISGENLAEITGYAGPDLQKFQAFLSQRMVCNNNCADLKVLEEIHGLWKVYQELSEKGIL